MTESQYTQSILRRLSSEVYSWKINAAFAKGVPDLWLSGPAADLWIEVKYLNSVPKSGRIIPNLSRLQLKWLQKRHKEGRNVAVLVGTPEAHYLLYAPIYWAEGFITNEYTGKDKKELIEHLERFVVLGENDYDNQAQQPTGASSI